MRRGTKIQSTPCSPTTGQVYLKEIAVRTISASGFPVLGTGHAIGLQDEYSFYLLENDNRLGKTDIKK